MNKSRLDQKVRQAVTRSLSSNEPEKNTFRDGSSLILDKDGGILLIEVQETYKAQGE